MSTFKKIFWALGVFVLLLVSSIPPAEAKSVQDLQSEIEKYEKELEITTAQANTLTSQINQFNAQIGLAELKIKKTEEKILLLVDRIDQLELSLESLTEAFSKRVVETYKISRFGSTISFLISSQDMNELVSNFYYLKKIQESDQNLLVRLQIAQTDYKEEKEDKVVLQKELEDQKAVLGIQKEEKAQLLTVTRNDEAEYQALLEQARAELAIALGQGDETFLRDVAEGEVIGRMVSGASGCSSGQHVHFEVHKDGGYIDPNTLLQPTTFSYSYSGDYYGLINPQGSWRWPVDAPIEVNQGYGSHGFAKVFYPGGVHRGFDLDSGSSSLVKAVRPGKLYAGAYQCGGSYPGALTYSKIEQDDGYVVWYMHITPQ